MKYILRGNKGLSWKQILSLRHYTTIVEYEFLAFWRTKTQALTDVLWFPILNPLLFGAGIGSFAPKSSTIFGTTNYLAFIFPGIVGLGFFRTFYHVIYRLTMDGRYGLQGLKISGGVGVQAYVLGNITLPSIIAMLQALVTMGVFILLSSPIESMSNVLLMLGVGMVSAWFWSVLAILISFSFKNYTQRDMFISLAMLPLTLSSPAFYPLENAPKYLQVVSLCNPLTYNIVALREAFLYGKVSSAFFLTVLLTLLFIIGSTALISKKEFVGANT